MRFPNLLDEYTLALDEGDREPDGLLHCSKHIWWPLRFSQLEMAGYPMQKSGFLERVNMLTGTLHHSFIEDWLRKRKDVWWELVDAEINLTSYLPDGWTGKCDWVFYDKEADHCILGDLKTIKPEGIQYLSGIKEDHLAQLSCYNAGLINAGYTMAPKLFVFYLPKNPLWTHKVEAQQLSSPPIEPDVIELKMKNIKTNIDIAVDLCRWSPMPMPIYKYIWNKSMNVFDVKQYPDWREQYTCPFDETLCPRTPIVKVGHWDLKRTWSSRKGYSPTGMPKPTEAEFVKRGG